MRVYRQANGGDDLPSVRPGDDNRMTMIRLSQVDGDQAILAQLRAIDAVRLGRGDRRRTERDRCWRSIQATDVADASILDTARGIGGRQLPIRR